MIHLYLIRHGIAADPDPQGFADEVRPLTAEGRRRFRRAAKAFARLGEPVDHVFTSSLVRAVQTAELFANALQHDEVGILPQLLPHIPAGELFAELGRRVKDEQSVAVVGHDPQMSAAVALAAGLTPQQSLRLEFRKGMIVRIDVKALPRPQPAQARWWMRPKRRELVEGLPLHEPKPPPKSNGKGKQEKGDKGEGTGSKQ